MARSSDFARRADQAGGRLIATLLPRRARPLPERPRRVVVIQPTAIGDTLIGSATLAAMHRAWPEAELILAHGASNAAAARMIDAPLTLVETGFSNPFAAARRLKALGPDLAVDLCPWPYATALAARLSAPAAAGFAPSFGARGRLFDLAVPHRTDRHERGNHAALAAALGLTDQPGMAIRRDPAALPADIAPEGLVLAHVSAGGARAAAKGWPAEHWVRLARALADEGWRLGFTGVAADAAQVSPILAAAGLPEEQAFSLCGRLPLPALAELLARVPLLISVDTGVLHLSAAVEGRALGLHGPTRAARWGSISPRALGLDAPHPAAGYIQYGWEEHPQAAAIMPTLTPGQAIAAARELLTMAPRPLAAPRRATA